MAYREDVVGDIARRLGAEQARVRAALATLDGMDDGRWLRGLDGRARERLLVQGHFPEYGSELEWNAREVVGHLRDSARIFTARIRALQTTSEPVLADFVTDDPARLADYRMRTLPVLLAELADAQRALHRVITSVTEAQLRRRGWHEVDGEMQLGDVLTFLPGHQHDHAEQLDALTSRPERRGT